MSIVVLNRLPLQIHTTRTLIDLIPAEPVQPTVVLKRHTLEGDTSPFLFDPLHFHQNTYHGGGPVVREHLERQALTTPEGFREAMPTPPGRHIDHLPTGESCLVLDDHAEINNLSHIPPWVHPLYVAILFGHNGYSYLHGEVLRVSLKFPPFRSLLAPRFTSENKGLLGRIHLKYVPM
jgi:hypothetical protein